jgi:hypothetical protein
VEHVLFLLEFVHVHVRKRHFQDVPIFGAQSPILLLQHLDHPVHVVRIRPPDPFATSCEDTPARPHATTTPYDPSPPRRDAMTHVTSD